MEPAEWREEKEQGGKAGGQQSEPVKGKLVDENDEAATEKDAEDDEGEIGVVEDEVNKAAETRIKKDSSRGDGPERRRGRSASWPARN